jgi:hypothetical protein
MAYPQVRDIARKYGLCWANNTGVPRAVFASSVKTIRTYVTPSTVSYLS